MKQATYSKALRMAVQISACLTMIILGWIVLYILIQGLPHLSLEQFSWTYNSENVSMMPAIINTLSLTILSLMMALPFGIGCAIYLVEYAKKGSYFVSIVRLTTETLSGIPSIIFGLFGNLMFVILFKKYTLLYGAITLAIMILPLIIRTSEEALLAVPKAYREGSYGLGAGKLRTIVVIVLPCAISGILSGIILSIGRIVGESAALIYTCGTIPQIAGLLDSGRSLSVHMYALLSEGLYMEQAYATAVVLLVLVILINTLSSKVAKKIGGKHE